MSNVLLLISTKMVDLQLHTRRVNPVNSQFVSQSLIAIELVDGSLPILAFLEYHIAEAHAVYSFAATHITGESGNVPHQQRPERAEETLEVPQPEARRQVAHAYETTQELARTPGGNPVFSKRALSSAGITEISPKDVVVRAEVLHVVVVSADVATILLWGLWAGHNTKPSHPKFPHQLFPRRLLLRNLLPPRFSRVGLVVAFSAPYPGVGHPHRSNPPPAALTVAAKQERKNCATRSAALGNEHLSSRAGGSTKDWRPGLGATDGIPNAHAQGEKG